MKTYKKIILAGLILTALIGILFQTASAQVSGQTIWKQLNGAITPFVSTWTIGSSSNRISAIWANTLNATTLTVAGTASGDLNMGGFSITNLLNLTSTGTSTLATISVTDSQTITKSVSSLTNFLSLTGSGAFADSEPALTFTNTPGAITTARISSKPGTSYTASDFTIAVADSSKVLQDRLKINVSGNIGIGTSTPLTHLQVTATSTNATSTITIGKAGQTKGSCLELFNTAGTASYVYVVGTTLTVSASSCK